MVKEQVSDETDPHAPLRDDVRLLGTLLGDTLKEQLGEDTFNKIEGIRQVAKLTTQGDEQAEKALHACLAQIDALEFLPICRAFSHFLNYANIAEQYHRIRRSHWYQCQEPFLAQPGSVQVVFNELLQKGMDAEQILSTLLELDIDLVLTAHPTEVKRRTVMHKHDQISRSIEQLDRVNLTPQERARTIEQVSSAMTAIWQTPDIRVEAPTPLDEARWGFAVIEANLWQAIPEFMRDLDEICKQYAKQPIFLTQCPIRFGSWMGGDRDGNPNVTPQTTKEACFAARWVAADLYLQEINRLRNELSMNEAHGKVKQLMPHEKEPYRSFLAQVRQRLMATKDWAHAILNHHPRTTTMEPIVNKEELLKPLMQCYESLLAGRGHKIANGRLLDLIRRVQCFGVTLTRLDIRQEAAKHTELMDEMTQALEMGSYQTWTEEQRVAFLSKEIASQRPLFPKQVKLSKSASDTWETFLMLAKLPREGLGQYVISMASSVSDVLLVVLLQQESGMAEWLPVVPLFETLKDLQGAAKVIDQLFSQASYRACIAGQQEVMIGYSDSAKDAGLLAASWAQYQAQEELYQVATQYQIKLRFFHGRGGSVGRGGWPTHIAIRSLPPGTLNGQIRVTQQGEVIYNRFGHPEIARRTFHVYTSATLEAILSPPPAPKQSWRALMNDLSRVSATQYHDLLAQSAFMDYFQQATPTHELGRLAIGSRPTKRKKKSSDLKDLRAIPWAFAWTQNRLLLPAWLGLGAALQYMDDTHRHAEMKDMMEAWPFFHSMIEMFEMVLAKANEDISRYYDHRLLENDLIKFGEKVRKEFSQTKRLLLAVIDKPSLLANNPVLDRSIVVRSTYLLPLHLIQGELLSRVRQGVGHKEELRQALLVSIAGIAAGMRNTG